MGGEGVELGWVGARGLGLVWLEGEWSEEWCKW